MKNMQSHEACHMIPFSNSLERLLHEVLNVEMTQPLLNLLKRQDPNGSTIDPKFIVKKMLLSGKNNAIRVNCFELIFNEEFFEFFF